MNYSNQNGVNPLSASSKSVCRTRLLSQLWRFHFLQHAGDGGILRLRKDVGSLGDPGIISRRGWECILPFLIFFLNNWNQPQFKLNFVLIIILGFA